MTSLGLKKDRTETYQGSSASLEWALSCPSAEGFTILSYGDGHFRAGSHFLPICSLSVSPRDESTNLWSRPGFQTFLDCEFSVTLCQTTLLSLSFILCQQIHLCTQKPIHPLLFPSVWGKPRVECHSSKSLHLERQCPEVSSRGFRCLVWFVPAGAESMSSFKTKTKTKNRVSKDFIIFFQIPIHLPDVQYNEEDQHWAPGLVYIGTPAKQC